MPFTCQYCDHKPFATANALSNHVARSAACQQARNRALHCRPNLKDADGFLKCIRTNCSAKANYKDQPWLEFGYKFDGLAPRTHPSTHDEGTDNTEIARGAYEYEDDDEGLVPPAGSDASDEEEPIESQNDGPDVTIRASFWEYTQKARAFRPFNKKFQDCLKLMYILRLTKAPLKAYDSVMEWHLKANKLLWPWETASGSSHFFSRKRAFTYLRDRYNIPKNYLNLSKIVLPSSKARVNMVWIDAKHCLQSLLTDPRIRAKDYIFGGEDPFNGFTTQKHKISYSSPPH